MVVFLLHGYVASSSAALRRTVAISCAVSLCSTILEGVFIWPLHIQLYVMTQTNPQNDGDRAGPGADMVWHKWAFWLANSLFFVVVYLCLLVLPLTRWRDLLPSKDMFHYYVRILFAVNLVRFPACAWLCAPRGTTLQRVPAQSVVAALRTAAERVLQLWLQTGMHTGMRLRCHLVISRLREMAQPCDVPAACCRWHPSAPS